MRFQLLVLLQVNQWRKVWPWEVISTPWVKIDYQRWRISTSVSWNRPCKNNVLPRVLRAPPSLLSILNISLSYQKFLSQFRGSKPKTTLCLATCFQWAEGERDAEQWFTEKAETNCENKRRPLTCSSKSNVMNESLNSLMGSARRAVAGGQRSV